MFKEMLPDLNFEDLDPVCPSVDAILFDTFPDMNEGVETATQDKIKAEEISCSDSIETSPFSCTTAEPINETPFAEAEQFLLSAIPTPEEDEAESVCVAGDMPFLDLEQPQTEIHDFMPKLSESASSESHTATLHENEASSTYPLDVPMFYSPQVVHEPFVAPFVPPNVHPQDSYAAPNMSFTPQQEQYFAAQHYQSLQQFPYDPLQFAPAGCENTGKKSSSSSKRYKLTQPSKFCHVCVRSGDQVRLAPCANVKSGLCRKAVCEKCFEKHGFGHEWNIASLNYGIIAEMNNRVREHLPDSAWTCFHCRSQCPSSAQCKIYARTNKRRHIILKQRKAAKERAAAERNATTGSIGKGRKKTTGGKS